MSADEDPAAWLRATIEADLALARRLAARWVAPPDHPRAGEPVWPSPSTERLGVYRSDDPDVSGALDLIRMCSPAYVIARCEAELAILDLYEQQAAKAAENAMQEDRAWTLWPVIVLLAEGYRHRDGYAERWATPPEAPAPAP